jgi:hypothetical protein
MILTNVQSRATSPEAIMSTSCGESYEGESSDHGEN